MRLLFDENLSDRLVPTLDEDYPGSVHVRSVGLAKADDEDVWSYALEHEPTPQVAGRLNTTRPILLGWNLTGLQRVSYAIEREDQGSARKGLGRLSLDDSGRR